MEMNTLTGQIVWRKRQNMKAKFLYLLFLSIFITLISRAQLPIENTSVDTATVIRGLDIPWEILWGPDDHIWVTERFGRVSRINPETGEQVVILDLTDQVIQSGESGLLGMALHPDFDSNPYVYLAYTYADGGDIYERIVRFEYNGIELVNEQYLITNIPGSYNHDGARLIISNDNKLLITTGDALNQQAAQDINDLRGKVLRINLDGTVPPDNPFPANNPVWSYGHRNAQGLFQAENGIIYSSEHGPSTDDEFNIIEPGKNYGWPNVHGFCDESWEQSFCLANEVTEPLKAWTPTVAASDLIIYNHPSIPEWQGSVLMTTLKNKRIYELELNDDGTQVMNEKQFFNNYWGRLRDICVDPDGAVYLATNGQSWSNTEPFTHSIIKVWNDDYTGVGDQENLIKRKIKIRPNPASTYIDFDASSNGFYEVMETMGRILLEGEVSKGTNRVIISALPNGSYILRLATGSGSSSALFLKK
jgi:glucose/arabinose dehydrogenase